MSCAGEDAMIWQFQLCLQNTVLDAFNLHCSICWSIEPVIYWITKVVDGLTFEIATWLTVAPWKESWRGRCSKTGLKDSQLYYQRESSCTATKHKQPAKIFCFRFAVFSDEDNLFKPFINISTPQRWSFVMTVTLTFLAFPSKARPFCSCCAVMWDANQKARTIMTY